MAERLYTVGTQTPKRAMVGGQITDVLDVYYTGPNGISGYITVPTATATPELVDTLIRRELDTRLQIAALGEQT
jgi:hypothetical protein